MELQRAFAVFLNRVYFRNKLDVEEIFLQAGTAEEVGTMLEKNVDRWIEEWKKEGEIRGEARGEARGRAEGKAAGKTEGDIEARMRVAKRLLKAGMSVINVAEMTEFSEEEVQKLQDSVAN